MRDFTLQTFRLLLQELKGQGYTFQTFRDFLKVPAKKVIVLRHDVDARKLNSLQTAQIEAELEITGTYNFRMVPQSYDPKVIRQIAALGHEIGYHYEDLTLAAKKVKEEGRSKKEDRRPNKDLAESARPARGWNRKPEEKWNGDEILYEIAIRLFEEHLTKLRHIVPIDTICMHGSPLSKYDNRRIWEKYDYHDFGIIGEPYFDLDFSRILYLTDTGRRWDGERFSVRDKVNILSSKAAKSSKSEDIMTDQKTSRPEDQQTMEGCWNGDKRDNGNLIHNFHSTYDIIRNASLLPARIMLTIHPQRWDDRPLPWIREYVYQNIKNIVKRRIVTR